MEAELLLLVYTYNWRDSARTSSIDIRNFSLVKLMVSAPEVKDTGSFFC